MMVFIFLLGCYLTLPLMSFLSNKKDKLIACVLFTAWSYTYIMGERIEFHKELEAIYIKVDELDYQDLNTKVKE